MIVRRSQNIQDVSRISLLRRSGDVRSWYRVAGPTLLLCSRGGGLAQTMEDEAKYVSLGRTARGGEPRARLGFWYEKIVLNWFVYKEIYWIWTAEYRSRSLFDMVISDNKLGAKNREQTFKLNRTTRNHDYQKDNNYTSYQLQHIFSENTPGNETFFHHRRVTRIKQLSLQCIYLVIMA